MDDFTYEIVQKKRLAQQAKYRKRGSKSKKCSLSTDYMTRKQWEKRCGEVMTYELGKPMTWEEFQQLPPHIQKEYLLRMIEKYQTTASDLARMFGISSPTMTKFCKSPDIGISFTAGKRMPKEKKAEFAIFLSSEDVKAAKGAEDGACECIGQVESMGDPGEPLQLDNSKPSELAMTEFSLCFNGAFNKDMIFNSILSMLPSGTEIKMEIKCTIVS